MSDHWGDSLITEFVADSKSVSFIKKYKQRSDIINYSFKQKKGDIWVGTWNMNKSGITNSTGTAELTLTPFDASN